MKVRELYTLHVLTAHPGEDLSVAASRMQFHEIGALAVYEKGDLAGIITVRDVLRAVGEGRVPEATAEYMSPEPVTVTPEVEAGQAAALMLSLGARHLPVTEGGELVGMLSARDLLSAEAWDDLAEVADSQKAARKEG